MQHSKVLQNPSGRDFVVTDINGCYNELVRLTELVGFDDNDRLFMLGNSLNRGLDPLKVLKFTTKVNVFPVLGNDEFNLLLALMPGMPEDERATFLAQSYENGGSWIKDISVDALSGVYNLVKSWPLSYTYEGDKKIGMVHSESPFDSWEQFTSSPVDYGLIQSATTGQTILQGARDGFIGGVDKVLSGHFQIPKPPVEVGNSFFLNSGIIVGKKGVIYSLQNLKGYS